MPDRSNILKLAIISLVIFCISHMALRKLSNRLATIIKTPNSDSLAAVRTLSDIVNNNKFHDMSTSDDYTTVSYVTTPNETVARKLARGLIEQRLAACVNMVKGVESIYEWEGKIEQETETLLIIKSHSLKSSELTKYVQSNHPYDCPEVVTLKVDSGSEPYLNWVRDAVNKRVLQTKHEDLS